MQPWPPPARPPRAPVGRGRGASRVPIVVVLLVLGVLLADCSSSTRFVPAPLAQRLAAALHELRTDGVQLEPAPLPPTYYDTVSDHPSCVGAGDVVSVLRRAETGGTGLTVLRDQRPGAVPVTVALTVVAAPLAGVEPFLAACSDHRITSGTLGPASVRVRAEPGGGPELRLPTETRSPRSSGPPQVTRTLLARAGGAGLLVVLGPAPDLPPALVDAVRAAALGVLARG